MCSDEFFQITGCAADSDRDCTSCTIRHFVLNMNEWCSVSSFLRIQFGTHSCDEMFERMKNYISMVHHASTGMYLCIIIDCVCVLIDLFDYWVTSSEKYMYYNYIQDDNKLNNIQPG